MPPPPAPHPSERPAAPAADQERAVRDAIARYERAANALDVAAVQAIWPSVDAGTLSRSYSGFKSQQLSLSSCELHLEADVATADCQRQLTMEPKVGKAQQVSDRVHVTLRRAGAGWVIERLGTR